MKIGTLMTGVAVIAMAAAVATAAAAGAQAAEINDKKDSNVERPNLVVAQLGNPSGGSVSNAELAARIQALEDAQSAASDRAQSDRSRLSTLEQGYNSAVWAFDNGRATFASGDGRFTLAFRARFQADFAGFMQDTTHPAGFSGPNDLSTGSVVRRAYFGIEGKAYKDFSYELRFNAGGSDGGNNGTGITGGEGDPLLNKAVISYTGIPNWHFNVGIIEPAFMMEGTTSSASLMFMERPDFENMAADTFGAGDSRRGVEVGWAKTDTFWAGDNVTGTFTFSGGKTGSAAGHGSNSGTAVGGGDEQSQVLARITDRVWSDGISNLQFGLSAASVLYSGSNGNVGGGSQTIRLRDRPEIRVDGTRLIDTGGIAAKTADMFEVDMQANWENFYFGGEYTKFMVDRQCGATLTANPVCTSPAAVADHPSFTGWALEASWILTGETKAYTAAALNNETGGFQAPIPSRPFSMDGGSWGAWELVARYTDTDLNWRTGQLASTTQLAGILGGEERIVSLGVNWYLNRNIRIMLDDNIVSVSKGTAALPDRDSQDFNVVGLRFQYAN